MPSLIASPITEVKKPKTAPTEERTLQNKPPKEQPKAETQPDLNLLNVNTLVNMRV